MQQDLTNDDYGCLVYSLIRMHMANASSLAVSANYCSAALRKLRSKVSIKIFSRLAQVFRGTTMESILEEFLRLRYVIELDRLTTEQEKTHIQENTKSMDIEPEASTEALGTPQDESLKQKAVTVVAKKPTSKPDVNYTEELNKLIDSDQVPQDLLKRIVLILFLAHLLNIGKYDDSFAQAHKCFAEQSYDQICNTAIPILETPIAVWDRLDSYLYFALSQLSRIVGNTNGIIKLLSPHYRLRQEFNDSCSVATIVNQCLASLVQEQCFEEAASFVALYKFPPSGCSLERVVMYDYLYGKVCLISGWISEAVDRFSSASLKLEESAKATGFGFLLRANLICSQLLIDVVPPPKEFQFEIFGSRMQPFVSLAHAVQTGSQKLYSQTVDQYSSIYNELGLSLVVVWIKQCVARKQFNNIARCYKCIGLEKVGSILGIDSTVEIINFIVHAIKRGNLNLKIDSACQYVISDMSSNTERGQSYALRMNKNIDFLQNLYKQIISSVNWTDKEVMDSFNKDRDVRKRHITDIISTISDMCMFDQF